jgi:hypothetical protein
LRHGQLDEAEGFLETGRSVLANVDARDEYVNWQILRSRLFRAREDNQAASKLALEASSRAHELNLIVQSTEADAWLCELFLGENPTEAQALASRGLESAKIHELPEVTWRFERTLARCALAFNDQGGALRHYQSCIRTLQAILPNVPANSVETYLDHPERRRVFVELRALATGAAD